MFMTFLFVGTGPGHSAMDVCCFVDVVFCLAAEKLKSLRAEVEKCDIILANGLLDNSPPFAQLCIHDQNTLALLHLISRHEVNGVQLHPF
jgi:hypothetical protein